MARKVEPDHRPENCRWSLPVCRSAPLADDDVIESVWECEWRGVPFATSPEGCRRCPHWEPEPDRHREGIKSR